MDAAIPDTSPETSALDDQPRAAVVKALFVRLSAKQGKAEEVETLLRNGLLVRFLSSVLSIGRTLIATGGNYRGR